jgi:hypothetical protein
MAEIVYEHDFEIPSWALPYLINNDDSGLEPEEKLMIDNWLKNFEKYQPYVNINPIDDTEHFSKYPAFGIMCICATCTLQCLQ